MKNIILMTLTVIFLFLFTGCPFDYGYRYNEGKFPSDPVNLLALNSVYDDYNMNSPVIESQRFLYFSSNRNSFGNDFDIVGDDFHVLWDKDKGTLEIDNDPATYRDFRYTDSLFLRMNTSFNEYGPYSLSFISSQDSGSYFNDFIIFSNDASGDLDLKMVRYKGDEYDPSIEEGEYNGPVSLSIFNSDHDDAYLSFYGPNCIQYDWGMDPEQITEAVFCSDRGGDFDIYQSMVPASGSILDFLQGDSIAPVIPVEILNSTTQDKCPFINGDLMVFSSDRPGGFGGFDLYYSRRNGDSWSEPVNFGDKINTSSNEYRPIVILYYEFDKDLLLFSSDRPGGKGGYDLYFVGIQKMITESVK